MCSSFISIFLEGTNSLFTEHGKAPFQNLTSPWELMDPRTKNDSDKTQDIRIPYGGNGYV